MSLKDFNPSGPANNGGGGSTGGPGGPTGSSGGPGGGGGMPFSPFAPMDDDDFDPKEYLINYNEKFKYDAPIKFRDNVIHQTLSCLIGKFKPNALLIGAAGVGKTKIAEDIARRIAIGDDSIPDQLLGYTVWELPISNIVAGSGIVGEVEKKTKAILKFAQDPKNKVILFIDEIHMLIGESQTYEKIAQIMKPALSRGDLRVIGSTTLQESQNLMDDPAFNRRFTRLIVDELSQSQTIEILQDLSVVMFNHYNQKIAVNDKIINEIVITADEYKTIGSHRPDNAITLLDRAMADLYIKRKMLEIQAQNDPVLDAALKATPIALLSKSDMKRTAMRIMTGNNEKTEPDMPQLQTGLSVVKGQDDVIAEVLDMIERDSLNIYPRTKPLSLLFAGNSGVGKTEIAKIIAKEITNQKPIILNMTEYHSSASITRIIGSSAGYVGYDSKTELPFDILESNPYQIILLDEFEKANRSVQRLFMSAMDEGYIKTARGKLIDFSKSIIIATTNAGHTNKSDPIGFTTSESNAPTATISDLSSSMDVELLNRFTKVFDFHPITATLYREILADRYARDVAEIKKNHSSYRFLDDNLPDDVLDTLVKDTYADKFGARPAGKTVQKYIEDAILEHNRAKAAQAAQTAAANNTVSDDANDVADSNVSTEDDITTTETTDSDDEE